MLNYHGEWVNCYDKEAAHVKDWDMFITAQSLKDSPAVLTLGKVFEEDGYSYEWKEGQSPILTKVTRSSVASRKLCTHGRNWIYCRAEAKQKQHRETERRQLRETGCMKSQIGCSIFRKECYKENLACPAVLLKRFQKHLLHTIQGDPRTDPEGNTIYLLIFRRTPMVTCANAQRSRELHADGILKVEKTGYHNQQHFGSTITANRKVHNEEQVAIATSMCGGDTRFGYSMDTQFSVQKQNGRRYDGMCAAILTSRKQAWSFVH